MGINRVAGLRRLAILAAALGLLSWANPAAAQYITYAAANGNDANPCTVVTAPCKTLQRAVNVTTAKGTVRVLTPLTSSVFINKSITIEGVRPTIVGQITIGGATAVVTLRGLALSGVGGYVNGIRIDGAAVVHIEDCTVERYTDSGIKLVATTDTELFISDTVARGNGAHGLFVDDVSARVTVENSRFEDNFNDGLNLLAAEANVTRSATSGNNFFGLVVSGETANITETTAADNSTGGLYLAGGVAATVVSTVAHGHPFYGLVVYSGTATITDSVFTSNPTGIHNSGTVTLTNSVVVGIVNSGTIYTLGNNTISGTESGSALQPFAAR